MTCKEAGRLGAKVASERVTREERRRYGRMGGRASADKREAEAVRRGKLPGESRPAWAVRLADVEEVDLDTIARRMNVSLVTVSSYLSRGWAAKSWDEERGQ